MASSSAENFWLRAKSLRSTETKVGYCAARIPAPTASSKKCASFKAWADEVSNSVGQPGSGDGQASSIEVQRLLAQ